MSDRNIHATGNGVIGRANRRVVETEQPPDDLDVLMELSSLNMVPADDVAHEPIAATIDAVRARAGLDRTAPRYRRRRVKNSAPRPLEGGNGGAEDRRNTR